MKALFDITFRDKIKGSSKEELFRLLEDLRGKDGRTTEILRKEVNKELIKRF